MRRFWWQAGIGAAATVGWPLVVSRVIASDFYPPLGALALGLAVVTGLSFRDRLGDWLRITPKMLGIAVAAGLAQAALTHAGYGLLAPWLPALRDQVTDLYTLMGTGLGPLRAMPVVVLAIVVEELVWRGVLIEQRDADRRGMWLRAALSVLLYTLAQAGSGSWALALTAFVCGWAWWAMRVISRSLSAAIVMHLLWSLLVLVFVPLEA